MKKNIVLKLFILIIFFTSCNKTKDFVYNLTNLNHINYLFDEIKNEYEDEVIGEKIKELIELIKKEKNKNDLYCFLGEKSEKENEIIKDVCYFAISDFYLNIDKNISCFYLNKISQNFYSVIYGNYPIGYEIAKRIIENSNDFFLKEKMYNILLDKYYDYIDPGITLYELSVIQKKNFYLNKAIKNMEKLVENFPNLRFSEFVIDIVQLKKEIELFKTNRKWVFSDIYELVSELKKLIREKKIYLVYDLISRNKFEIKNFEKPEEEYIEISKNVLEKVLNSCVTFYNEFEEFSIENTLFLKAETSLSSKEGVIYFSFNKIDYPFDITLNGGWEWNAIYLGKPFY